MSTIKVSVILPVYNVEQYLNECLVSLKNQTLNEVEFICVDDGSIDNSINIVKEYVNADNRFILLQQENKGAGSARNNGMKIAKGEYLLFLDADDFFSNELLEKAYNKAIMADADIVLFGGKKYDTITGEYIDASYYFHREYLPDDCEVFSHNDIPDEIFLITTTAPWTKLFKREFIQKNHLKFQNIPNSNDVSFVLLGLSLAERISYVDEELVYYRIGQSQNIQSLKHKNPLCFLKAYEEVYDELVARGIWKKLEKSWTNAAISACSFNIDTVQEEEAVIEIYRRMFSPEFSRTGIWNHPLNFYRNRQKAVNVRGRKYALQWYDKIERDNRKSDVRVVIDNRSEEDQSPLVSVIIPVYNVAKYLITCLESICKQTLKEIEIICINDGSTDNSYEVLIEYAKTDSRIVVYNQSNRGLSATRNEGVRCSRGEYIYFMDSDDSLELTALDTLYQRATQDDLDVLLFDGASFSDDYTCKEIVEQNREYYIRKHLYEEKSYAGVDLLVALLKNEEYRTSVCLQMINKKFFVEKDLWFYEGILHEDNLFTFKCMLSAEKSAHINSVLFYRRYRQESIMTTKTTFAHAYGYFLCYLEMLKFYESLPVERNNEMSVLELLHRIMHSAQNSFGNVEQEEQMAVMGLSKKMQMLFRLYVAEIGCLKKSLVSTRENLKKTWDEKSEINRKLQITYKEKAERGKKIKELEHSTTYKVGKIIMWLPCRIKRIISGRRKENK